MRRQSQQSLGLRPAHGSVRSVPVCDYQQSKSGNTVQEPARRTTTFGGLRSTPTTAGTGRTAQAAHEIQRSTVRSATLSDSLTCSATSKNGVKISGAVTTVKPAPPQSLIIFPPGVLPEAEAFGLAQIFCAVAPDRGIDPNGAPSTSAFESLEAYQASIYHRENSSAMIRPAPELTHKSFPYAPLPRQRTQSRFWRDSAY